MSTGTVVVTASDLKALASAYLHTGLLGTFLLGMYTPLYFGTMYIYLTRKSSSNRIVLAVTTILYVSNALGNILSWLQLRLLIGTSGESMSEGFMAVYDSNNGTFGLMMQILATMPFVAADGLLIWRCFKMSNNSLRIIVLPFILLLAETALYIANAIYATIITTEEMAEADNRILSAALFMTLAVTLWSTVFIAYRIYSTSNFILKRKKPRFYNIIEIVMQSSFLYSVALLPSALLEVIPLHQSDSTTILVASYYIDTILTGVAGIAPTIMVARIALTSNSGTDIVSEPTTAGVHVPSRQFGGDNPNMNGLNVLQVET